MTYYRHDATGEARWARPEAEVAAGEPTSDSDLPPGWKQVWSSSRKKVYYRHASGSTAWERPTSLN